MSSQIEDTDDLYTKLKDSLNDAVKLEHALMAQYIYAAFSINPKYEALRGQGTISQHNDLLGVAIEEMRHLHIVSVVLSWLEAPPIITPVIFPFESKNYPFKMELKRLDPTTLAQYVYAEAPDMTIGPKNPDQDFIDRMKENLGKSFTDDTPGSLYDSIIQMMEQLGKNLPARLRQKKQDFYGLLKLVEAVKVNGVGDHYKFFRDVFMGTSPLLGGSENGNAWDLPITDAKYPSRFLSRFADSKNYYQADLSSLEPLKKLVLLADLHYWITLGLLNMSYRFDDWCNFDNNLPRPYLNLAQRHMRGPILKLGLRLAELGFGVPFNDFPENNDFPKKFSWDDKETAERAIGILSVKANEVARSLDAESLPIGFRLNIYSFTLSGLRQQ